MIFHLFGDRKEVQVHYISIIIITLKVELRDSHTFIPMYCTLSFVKTTNPGTQRSKYRKQIVRIIQILVSQSYGSLSVYEQVEAGERLCTLET